MRSLSIVLVGLATLPLANPVDDPIGEWTVERLELDVVVDPEGEALIGSADYVLRATGDPASEVVFEIGSAMEIVDVRSETGDGVVSENGTRATVAVGTTGVGSVKVTIRFRSRERSSQIVVAERAAFASWAQTWYPITGDTWSVPGTTRITIPSEWRAISTGRVDDAVETDGTRIETWVTEKPTARSFAAGPYTITMRKVGDREVGVYLLDQAGRENELLESLTATLESLEARFGPYPYPGYALAEVPSDLAEWTGSSEQGFFMARSDALDGPPNLPLIAHELAHGWWGNWVRAVMPGQLMAGEALAQYGAVVAIEAIEGDDAVTEFLRFSREGYNRIQSASGFWRLKIAGHDRPLAELKGEGADNNLADAKGHWVYHMLRRHVGDEVFFGTLRGLIEQHGGETLSLPELRSAFIEAAPDAGLERFFEQWLDWSGAPVISTSWRDVSEGSRHAVEVDIRQRTPQPYDVPFTIGVESDAGVRLHELHLTDRAMTVTLEAAGPPTGIIENADHAILMWESAYLPP